MKNLSLVLRIVAIVAAVAATALYFMGKGKLAEKQSQLEDAQAATKATQAELETANGTVASLETKLSSEREALADTKRKLEGVRSEMYTARQEVTRTQQQLRESKDKATELENTARRLRADLVRSEQLLAESSSDAEVEEMSARIEDLESANRELKDDLTRAESRAARARPTADTSTSTPAGPDYAGLNAIRNAPTVATAGSVGAEVRVASVSREAGLVVLQATPEAALTEGLQVTLVRDLKPLGKVQVVKVADGLAVANILPGSSARGIEEGETVSLLR